MATQPVSATGNDEQSHHHPPPTVYPAPLGRPIWVIGPAYLAPHPIDLTITERSSFLSEGEFNVTDVNGDAVFKIRKSGHSEKRYLVDLAGNTLLTMGRKSGFTSHDRWQGFRGKSKDRNDLLFRVKKTAQFQARTELVVFFAANEGEVPDLMIKGGPFEGSCDIFLGNSGVVLAKMRKQRTSTDKETAFEVTIYPTVDYAFIMGLIIILHEIKIFRTALQLIVDNLALV